MNRDIIQYEITAEDEATCNHTYKYEQELLERVRQGDISLILDLEKYEELQYPQLFDFNRKKSEEYMAACMITLLTRAVIEGGVTSAKSFLISDMFLKKLAQCQSVEQIKQVKGQALDTFLWMVYERKKSDSKGNYYVEEAKNFIAANIFKKITSSDVAGALNLSPVYLERIFKSGTGKTISQYIRSEKINLAKNLLKYSDRSIMEIGLYMGFSSQSNFGREFKKETGISPGQYRSENMVTSF